MDIDWISISPQNGAAGQNPVAFQLIAENETFEDKRLTVRAVCGDKYKDLTLVLKGKTFPIGTVWNFDYTGGVQQITLPKGKYKLQCWGAQGGNVTGTYAVNGSKGGYSEGVLTLTKTTKLYVFVGGQGTSYTSAASQTSTSVVNGGWNGGGAGVRTARYSSGDTDGRSFPRGGGGATDISTVTSSMSYSSGRTIRDSASLLARCIVAGGGAGASARYTCMSSTSEQTNIYLDNISLNLAYDTTYSARIDNVTLKKGVYKVTLSDGSSGAYMAIQKIAGTTTYSGSTISVEEGTYARLFVNVTFNTVPSVIPTAKITMVETTTTTSESNEKSSGAQQGGGASGKGIYPGTQLSAGGGTGKNLCNPSEITSGYYMNLNGTLKSNANYSVTGYIPIKQGQSLVCNASAVSTSAYHVWYDADKNILSKVVGSQYGQSMSWIEGAAYVRFTTYNAKASQLGGVQVELGTTSTAFEEYLQFSYGGDFGYGANQESTNYRYCAGGGGGGWYGGGTGHSDSSTNYVNYAGGGSGFVNTSANASSRPSGYTGLQLDSGTTKDGSTSFESTSGGTETGHSGNGYARITVLE